jgi:hypothetical protein
VKVAALIVVLTLALGFSLAAAYYLVGGRIALQGPYFLNHNWPVIFTFAALFAALVTAPIRLVLPEVDGRLVAVVIGAWFGEYLVLASGVLASELNPANAVLLWIAATGGPVQPLAAFVGAVIGGRLVQRSPARP